MGDPTRLDAALADFRAAADRMRNHKNRLLPVKSLMSGDIEGIEADFKGTSAVLAVTAIDELVEVAKSHRAAAEARLRETEVNAARAHRLQTIGLCLGLVFAAIAAVATGFQAYYSERQAHYAQHPQPVEQTPQK